MTWEYRGLQEVTGGYKGLQEVTRGYKWLQGVTRGYKKLQGVRRKKVNFTFFFNPCLFCPERVVF